MINEPAYITASCDQCGVDTDPMELCSLAGGGWDARNVKDQLKRWGWVVVGERTICDECSRPEDDA